MSGKVWVAFENHNMNYTPAEQYGEVHFVTDTEMTHMTNSKRNDTVNHDIMKFLADYQPGVDYLVLTGSTVFVGLLMMELGITHPDKEHLVLRWSNQDQMYVKYTLRSKV